MVKRIELQQYRAEEFENFDGTEVVVTPSLVLFWRPPNPFGQWTNSPFDPKQWQGLNLLGQTLNEVRADEAD